MVEADAAGEAAFGEVAKVGEGEFVDLALRSCVSDCVILVREGRCLTSLGANCILLNRLLALKFLLSRERTTWKP